MSTARTFNSLNDNSQDPWKKIATTLGSLYAEDLQKKAEAVKKIQSDVSSFMDQTIQRIQNLTQIKKNKSAIESLAIKTLQEVNGCALLIRDDKSPQRSKNIQDKVNAIQANLKMLNAYQPNGSHLNAMKAIEENIASLKVQINAMACPEKLSKVKGAKEFYESHKNSLLNDLAAAEKNFSQTKASSISINIPAEVNDILTKINTVNTQVTTLFNAIKTINQTSQAKVSSSSAVILPAPRTVPTIDQVTQQVKQLRV